MTAREIIKTFMYAADYMGVNLKDIDTGEIHMMGRIGWSNLRLLADNTRDHLADHYRFIRFDDIRTVNGLHVTLLVEKIND